MRVNLELIVPKFLLVIFISLCGKDNPDFTKKGRLYNHFTST